MEIRSRWAGVFSDLFVNMAAGWFGAIVVFPILGLPGKIDFRFLILDLIMAILSLLIAGWLRRNVYDK